MIHLIILAIAPVFIIAFYIYFRDKYEKEPIKLLLISLFAGILTVIPITIIESFLMRFSDNFSGYNNAFYMSFVVAGFTEEIFKFIALYFLIWRNRNFNEKFDGIVYAVFISLGFALIENINYVISNGAVVGLIRAFTAVPAHALFGISMGFHFGLAKFYPKKFNRQITFSLVIPILLHGIYDFILFSHHYLYLLLFLAYLAYLWIFGFRKMKQLSDASIYN